MKRTQEEKDRAFKKLKGWIKPGQTVWTNVTHVARSGMSRSIKPYIVVGKEIVDITYLASVVLDLPIDKNNGGVKIPGCGMDMGFKLVDDLRYVLYGDGKKLEQRWI